MKKTSKILSLLVALCMAVTMLSGLTVMAADPFELVSIDADSDFITLVFDQEVDTTNSTILLKKGDESVVFEFKKNNVSSSSSYPVQDRLTYHSYLVIPEGGIDLDEEYKITFSDVKSSDGVSTLAQDTYIFVVTDLGGQLTSARGATVDGAARTASETFNADGTITMNFTKNNAKYAQTETSYLATTVGKDYLSGVTVGNNRDATLPYYVESETSGPVTEKDYTIKVDFSNFTNFYTGHLGIGITDNINRMFTASYGYSTGVYFHLQTQSTAGRTHAFLTDKFAKKSSDTLGTELGGQYDQTKINGNYVITNVSRNNPIELKLAVKDGIARAYINGKLAADNVLARDYRGYAYIQGEIIKMADNPDTQTNDPGEGSITVSNFLATHATFVLEGEEPTPDPEPEVPAGPVESPEMIAAWDADLDFFTLHFAEKVAEGFTATITQGATEIPATVSSANYSSKTTGDRFTWKIKPADGSGFVEGIPYTVTVENVANVDTENEKKITSWSKTFKVEVLARGLDLTDGSVETKANKTSSNATFTNVDGDDIVVSANAYTDSTDTSFLYIGKTLDSGEKEANYTIKLTYSDFVNVGYEQGFIGILSSKMAANYNSDHDSLRGALHYSKMGNNATDNTVYSQIRTYRTEAADNKAYGPGALGSIKFRGTNPVPIELKLAVKDGVATSYLNGGKTHNETLDSNVTGAPQIMINLRSIPDTTMPASVKVSNFVATRAVETTEATEEFVLGEITVTEGVIAGQETVNISATLANYVLGAKDVFVICALYNDADAMTNIVISEVGEAKAGYTPLEFSNVETNGATYAKIFIWDDAETLNPWFPAITFE